MAEPPAPDKQAPIIAVKAIVETMDISKFPLNKQSPSPITSTPINTACVNILEKTRVVKNLGMKILKITKSKTNIIQMVWFKSTLRIRSFQTDLENLVVIVLILYRLIDN